MRARCCTWSRLKPPAIGSMTCAGRYGRAGIPERLRWLSVPRMSACLSDRALALEAVASAARMQCQAPTMHRARYPIPVRTPTPPPEGRLGMCRSHGGASLSWRATLTICAAKRRGSEVIMERVEQADAPSETTRAEDNADAIAQHESKEDCTKDLGFEPAMLPRLKFKKLRALAMRHGLSARTSASAIIVALRSKWENVCDVEAGRLRKDQPGWWEHTVETPANVVECESVEHLKATLKNTEEADKILLVDFYRPNCGACRSLHPKLEQLATEYSDRLVVLKVDTRLDEGVFAMSKRLAVEKVPYFQVYAPATGHVASFSITLSKINKLRAVLAEHALPQCSLACPVKPPEMQPWWRLGYRPEIKLRRGK